MDKPTNQANQPTKKKQTNKQTTKPNNEPTSKYCVVYKK